MYLIFLFSFFATVYLDFVSRDEKFLLPFSSSSAEDMPALSVNWSMLREETTDSSVRLRSTWLSLSCALGSDVPNQSPKQKDLPKFLLLLCESVRTVILKCVLYDQLIVLI